MPRERAALRHGLHHPTPKAQGPLTSFTMDLISLLASCRSSGFLLFNNLAKSWTRRVSKVKAKAALHLGNWSSPQRERGHTSPEDSAGWVHFTLDFSSSSNTGFLGRGGGEGISVLSTGISGSDCTMPER